MYDEGQQHLYNKIFERGIFEHKYIYHLIY